MTERPILFSAPMVRALLADTKTQTRRIVKGCISFDDDYEIVASPYGTPGDRLWVREAWRSGKLTDRFPPREMTPHPVWYDADGAAPAATNGKPRPGMFMPRWASRITLDLTGVRVERLQDISEADALAEGSPLTSGSYSHRGWYRELWGEINGRDSWATNPWVWVLSFRRITTNG